MANKYQRFARAHKVKYVDPVDEILNDDNRETMEVRINKANEAFAVARKMFQLLNESNLDSKGRATALQLLGVLQNRLGKQ